MTKENHLNKHAYCIIAHQDIFCLETLLRLLDYDKNDIFLLIDKKADHNIMKFAQSFKPQKSHFYLLPSSKMIDISWGGLSQVKAELTLFRAALQIDKYSYIHLLSGVDLPLKTPQEIHSFFNSIPLGSNIVYFSEGESIRKNVEFKTRFYHPFVEFQKFRSDRNICHFIQDCGAKIIRKLFIQIQKLIVFKRNWKDLKLKKGSQWVSISPDFAEYLVQNEDFILKKFNHVICPDEIFLHTMLYNSKFRNSIINPVVDQKFSIRLIDWERGTPYVWQSKNFEELIKSEALFARKFSSFLDKDLIIDINNYLKNKR